METENNVPNEEQELSELEEYLREISQVNEESSKKFLTALARARHWKKKSQKESEARKLAEEKKQEKPVEEEKPPSAPQPQFNEEELETRVLLRTQGYSPDEIKSMSAFAKATGKKLGEVIEDPFVKSGIEGIRSQQKSEQATPSSSSRSLPKKEKSWEEMNSEERKKNFPQFVSKKMAGKENE